MNRHGVDDPAAELSVPRASGDEPFRYHLTAPFRVVFPARAGMNRSTSPIPRRTWCVPRASGDEPEQSLTLAELADRVPRASGDEPLNREGRFYPLMCSPRERG